MEEAVFLTEEIVLKILTFLPVKSLIRFTCVSKCFHHIILSDPKFAKAQFEAACELKTLTHKLFIDKDDSATQEAMCDLESIELDAPVFGDHSSVRKAPLPFKPPVDEYSGSFVAHILGSSNGIVFLAFYDKIFYIWNPSTGFFKRLPDLVSPKYILTNYGVVYMPATDDYKVFVYYSAYFDNETTKAAVFSMRCNTWKSLWSECAGEPSVDVSSLKEWSGSVIFLNQALHWTHQEGDVVSFDLAEYKFREMAQPNFNNDDLGGKGINSIAANDEGFLTLVRHPEGVTHCVDVWVMKVYGVSGSWTKLFNLNIPLPPDYSWCPVWLMENCTVDVSWTIDWWTGLVRSYHREERKHEIYEIGDFRAMIRNQETLIKIDY